MITPTRDSAHLNWVITYMPEESARALVNFTTANAHFRGAGWDDCLDIYMDADAHLEWTEPMYELIVDDPLLRPNLRLMSAITTTLAWSDPTFAYDYTPAERLAAVEAVIRNENKGQPWRRVTS